MVGKLLAHVPLVTKGLDEAGRLLVAIGNLGHQMRTTETSIQRLTSEKATAPQKFGSEFGYTSTFVELEVALTSHRQLESPDYANCIPDSPLLFDVIIDTMRQILDSDKRVSKVVNFGVSFAHIDGLLAEAFPHIEFIGIDRSEQVRAYNETHFKERPNLSFLAGDVLDVLEQGDFKHAVLFHMRTLSFMPYSFVTKLYDAAAGASFSHICGFECWGLSRQLHGWYDLNDSTSESSVAFREHLFLHHYPRALETAGFHATECDLLPTRSRQPDYRTACFRAARLEDSDASAPVVYPTC